MGNNKAGVGEQPSSRLQDYANENDLDIEGVHSRSKVSDLEWAEPEEEDDENEPE